MLKDYREGMNLPLITTPAAGDHIALWDASDSDQSKIITLQNALGGATPAEVGAAADVSAQDSMAAGSGFAGTGTVYKSSVVTQGTIIKTEILIDLTGASSSTTDLDIIGTHASNPAYIGQITAAINGAIWFGQVTCLETPAGGVTDIDLYSATEGTGYFDDGIVSGTYTETALLTKGGAWSAAVTPVITANPAADQYLYLCGGAAGTAAAYTAGRFLIEFWGV